MPVGIIAALIAAAVALIVLLVQEIRRRREGTTSHQRDWDRRAADGLAGARSILDDTNPLRLDVGFSATETPVFVQRRLDDADAIRQELGAVAAGHPDETTGKAAADLSEAMMGSLGATATYVRAIANDHHSVTREERAQKRHAAAVKAADHLGAELRR